MLHAVVALTPGTVGIGGFYINNSFYIDFIYKKKDLSYVHNNLLNVGS